MSAVGRPLVCGISDQPQIEEMMDERDVWVDYSTLHRWVLKYVLALGQAFLARKRPVGDSIKLDLPFWFWIGRFYDS